MVYSFILSHQAHPYAQVGECQKNTPILTLVVPIPSYTIKNAYEHPSLRISVPRGLATRESVQSTAVLLGTSLPSIFSIIRHQHIPKLISLNRSWD